MNKPISKHSIELTVHAGETLLDGDLNLPDNALGLVVFAHGSGSSRFSPRNRYVANLMNEAGLATLLFDLLTSDEEFVDQNTREFRFDIELLSERMSATIDWLSTQNSIADLPIGLFGASTGAAAALNAAANRPQRIAAVVSRGGRPDLAMESLLRVTAPTLLIVGGNDSAVIDLNQQAADRLEAPHELHIVPGATHLFEEPGKLEEVAGKAREWFLHYFSHAEH